MALLALAACGGTVWREVDVRSVDQREQVFIIVTGKAFVFEVSATTADALQGTALRMWSFEPRAFSVRDTESPDETAHRLGWVPLPPERAPHEIRFADVNYASALGSRSRATPKSVATDVAAFGLVVGGIVVALFVGLVIALRVDPPY